MLTLIPLLTVALAGLQAVLMLVDELVYHRRRGLGVLESIGHPVDTAVFLAALAVPALAPPTQGAILVFAALAVLSMIVITKDEWIHAGACEPAEHWLHAMLFVVHAPVLIGVGLTWYTAPESPVLTLLPPGVGGWMLFQIAYWAFHHGKRRQRASEQRVLRRVGRQVV